MPARETARIRRHYLKSVRYLANGVQIPSHDRPRNDFGGQEPDEHVPGNDQGSGDADRRCRCYISKRVAHCGRTEARLAFSRPLPIASGSVLDSLFPPASAPG
jgi:hypothetical protein